MAVLGCGPDDGVGAVDPPTQRLDAALETEKGLDPGRPTMDEKFSPAGSACKLFGPSRAYIAERGTGFLFRVARAAVGLPVL